MKVIYFNWFEKGIHVTEFYSANCFYLPDFKKMIVASSSGQFGKESYSIENDENLIKEISKVETGKKPNFRGVKISEIRQLDFESSEIAELMYNIEKKGIYEKKSKAGIEKLIEKIK